MKKKLTIRLSPAEAADSSAIRQLIAEEVGKKRDAVTGFIILKRSIDARGKNPYIILSLEASVDEPFRNREPIQFHFPDVSHSSKKVLIVGAGPAGLFAALKLISLGIKPVILERGKDVRARRRDLARLNKEGIINPESNYCFGEGGAGTYSDGKLYTRSTKRGDVERILNLFVHFGAEENILYDAHPHIGTNKLPHIITSMRNRIIECGGEIHFNSRVVEFLIDEKKLRKIRVSSGEYFSGDACILATGHSARDIFQILNDKIILELKPFALGVRVEHPQELIDSLMYHTPVRDKYLPPASYSLVHQVDGKGVFSFCMCPGGIIAPASTDHGELVVNGWSPSRRNNPFANSGMVVSVEEKDLGKFRQHGKLAGMYFQKDIESKAFEAGGGKFKAPAQRLIDFTENKVSASLPDCSYVPGIHSFPMIQVIPAFIHSRLILAFREFGKKLPGRAGTRSFLTNEAVIVATESRTSSPVRIPRDKQTLANPQVENLYPCGEGAGYAGGIVSAAMDGERVADMIGQKLLA